MTNTDTELYELCKQVYELTGWNRTEFLWVAPPLNDTDYKIMHKSELRELNDYIKHPEMIDKMYNSTFCYDTDYLLEKLPNPLIYHNNDCAIEIRRTKKDKYMWSANIRHSYGQYFKQISDTPLKALLKLTLKLHEEKIL